MSLSGIIHHSQYPLFSLGKMAVQSVVALGLTSDSWRDITFNTVVFFCSAGK